MPAEIPQPPYHVVRDKELHEWAERERSKKKCACNKEVDGYHGRYNCQHI